MSIEEPKYEPVLVVATLATYAASKVTYLHGEVAGPEFVLACGMIDKFGLIAWDKLAEGSELQTPEAIARRALDIATALYSEGRNRGLLTPAVSVEELEAREVSP